MEAMYLQLVKETLRGKQWYKRFILIEKGREGYEIRH